MAIFRRLGDKVGEATALGHLAWAALCLGDLESCYKLASTALTIYEAHGAQRNAAITLRTVALAASTSRLARTRPGP